MSSKLAKAKLSLQKREQEIFDMQEGLASKEELEMLSREVIEKDEQLAQANLNLRTKENLLNEENQVITKK